MPGRPHENYELACERLAAIARQLGFSIFRGGQRHAEHRRPAVSTGNRLEEQISIAGLSLKSETVMAAAVSISLLAAAVGSVLLMAILVMRQNHLVWIGGVAVLAIVAISHMVVLSYPGHLARQKARAVMRGSSEGLTLMIMSLRHEPSIPNALRFASDDRSPFAHELRSCVWKVISGVHDSFEDSLLAFADRWEKYCLELKGCVNSMITASKEATQDGRRRALERASGIVVDGARRKVEEYAASLSTPSMVLFGLGVLLPIMVGSFLPMLSWSSLTMMDTAGLSGPGQETHLLETVFLMNLVFPAAALLIALDASSKHPMPRQAPSGRRARARAKRAVPIALLLGTIGVASSDVILPSGLTPQLILLACVIPVSAALMFSANRLADRPNSSLSEEDALFRIGARMAEGDNFESALHAVSGERLTCQLRLAPTGGTAEYPTHPDSSSHLGISDRTPAEEALGIVGRASMKDERAAGVLAMDLASYLRDLEGIENDLKTSLRPTVSMMRMTAHALGPIVLGITYAIYVSMAGVGQTGDISHDTGPMLIVLGVFLAEMNVVVCYFLWGIEGGKDVGALCRSTGLCILTSQGAFLAAATLAA